MFGFCQELLVHPCKPPCSISCRSGWTILEFGGADLWKLTISLGSLFSPGPHPVGLFQVGPWMGQILVSWNLGLWSCFLLCAFLLRSWTPPSHGHCSFTSPVSPSLFVNVKASRALLLVGSSVTFVRDLWINAFPKHFALLVPCSAAPPADTRMVKVPHEDQGLQTWSFWQLSEEGLFYFFLIRGSVADTQDNFAHVVLPQQLPVNSSSIPRQRSLFHSCCCLT